jgi:hypothetical protein
MSMVLLNCLIGAFPACDAGTDILHFKFNAMR